MTNKCGWTVSILVLIASLGGCSKPTLPVMPETRAHADVKADADADTDTLALAFVISGNATWIGNEDYEPVIDQKGRLNAWRVAGALKTLKISFDKLSVATLGPAGSQGAVITYADRALIRTPMGDLKNLNGSALGKQEDYRPLYGTELVSGIELGLQQLESVVTKRKVLIVIGDGTDENSDTAKARLAALKKQAKLDRVEVFAIVLRGALYKARPVVSALTPHVATVKTADDLMPALDDIFVWMKR